MWAKDRSSLIFSGIRPHLLVQALQFTESKILMRLPSRLTFVPCGMEYDIEYRNRIALAVYEAVVLTSKGDADVATIKTGPAFDALMMVAAFVIAGQPDLATPQDVREFTENAAKKLRKEILEIRSDSEKLKVFGTTFDPTKAH